MGEKPVLGKQSGIQEPPCERTALLALPIPPPPRNLGAFSSGPSERDSAAVALPILHADVHLQSLQRGGLNAHQTQSVCTDLLGFFLLLFLSLSLLLHCCAVEVFFVISEKKTARSGEEGEGRRRPC